MGTDLSCPKVMCHPSVIMPLEPVFKGVSRNVCLTLWSRKGIINHTLENEA